MWRFLRSFRVLVVKVTRVEMVVILARDAANLTVVMLVRPSVR